MNVDSETVYLWLLIKGLIAYKTLHIAYCLLFNFLSACSSLFLIICDSFLFFFIYRKTINLFPVI